MTGNEGDFSVFLRRAAVEPQQFAELLRVWNAEFDPDRGRDGPPNLTAAADEALRIIASRGDDDFVGPQIAQMINCFPHCVVVAGRDGRVLGLNTQAMARLDLDIGAGIDGIGYALEAAEPISAVIGRLLDPLGDGGEIVLKHAIHLASDRPATLAIVPAPMVAGRTAAALVFVIDPERRQEAEALMAQTYGLTAAEAEVAGAFLGGQSLAAIAGARGRSHATVRTQFQSAMTKTGARSQAEFMRNGLALSQFVSEIAEVAEVARHPHRKVAQILRPGGRLVDVTLAGDMNGQPMVFLSTLTQHTLTPAVEAELAAAGLLAVHLWRPGFGRTDPPGPGRDRIAALVGDFTAVIAHLGLSRCPLVGLNASVPDALQLGGACPERISRLIVLQPVVPRPHRRARQFGASWPEAIGRTTAETPLMLSLMVRAGLRAWKLVGTRRFAALQLGRCPADLGVLNDPAVIAELDKAMTESNAQGVATNMADAAAIVSDWSAAVAACRMAVEIVAGVDDPCTDIDTTRRFIATHADRFSLTEIEGAGFYALFSHSEAVIARLAAAD